MEGIRVILPKVHCRKCWHEFTPRLGNRNGDTIEDTPDGYRVHVRRCPHCRCETKLHVGESPVKIPSEEEVLP